MCQAREQKLQKTPYDKLPADLRKGMTKKEYESIEFRDDDEEGDEKDGGLLPVVVFSFSKKQCEANAEFFGGKDLLTKREKGKVGKMLQQVRSIVRARAVDFLSLLLYGRYISTSVPAMRSCRSLFD